MTAKQKLQRYYGTTGKMMYVVEEVDAEIERLERKLEAAKQHVTILHKQIDALRSEDETTAISELSWLRKWRGDALPILRTMSGGQNAELRHLIYEQMRELVRRQLPDNK